MTVQQKRRLFSAVLLLGILAAAIGLILPFQRTSEAFDPNEPPVIDLAGLDVLPPISGATVRVLVQATALSNAGPGTAISARNVTTGDDWTMWAPYAPTQYVLVTGGAGDLIEFRATNDGGTTVACEEVGYAPEGTDIAAPFLDLGLVTTSFTGGTFTVSGSAGAVMDQSFPASLELSLFGSTATDTAAVGGSGGVSTGSFSVSLAATTGDRAVLLVTDDYGNRTEIHFRVDTTIDTVAGGFFPTSYGSPGQANSEYAGNAPVVSHDVLAASGEFTTSTRLLQIRGAVLDVLAELHYRSESGYEGPVGDGWDWMLDARIKRIGTTKFDYYPGNGLRIRNFTRVGSSNEFNPPDGVFQKLVRPSGTPTVYLEDRSGKRLVFELSGGSTEYLLKRIEDHHARQPGSTGNTIELTRDSLGRVVQLKDDLDRVSRFAWFDTGQLATITDFGGRRTHLDYDDEGRLIRVTWPNEAWSVPGAVSNDWFYDSGSSRIVRVRDVANRDVLINTYDVNGRVDSQRNSHNIDVTEPAIQIEYDDSPTGFDVVRVTDALGDVTLTAYEDSQPHFPIWIERRADPTDRNTNPGYPGVADDPFGWREYFEFDRDNYLLSGSHHRIVVQCTGNCDDTYEPQNMTGPLEERSWGFASPEHADPRLRGRIATRSVGPPGSELTESWAYGPGGSDAFPSSHTDLDGVVTSFTYNGAGQTLETSVGPVTMASSIEVPNSYTIKTKREYDTRGRITATYSPNRLAIPGANASTEYEYHTSGMQAGYLSKTIRRNQAGTQSLEETFSYDVFGNVTERSSPFATSQSATWSFEYDELDRLTSEAGPDATLHSGNVVHEKRRYVYSGGVLTEVWRKYWDEDGIAGTGTHGVSEEPVEIQETENVYDIRGRYVGTRSDFGWGGASVQRADSSLEYNLRGDVVKQFDVVSAAESDEVEFVYDSRGLLAQQIRKPGGGAENLVTWYRYDFAGRMIESFDPKWTEPRFVIRDVFGRVVSAVSTVTHMEPGDGSSNDSLGCFETRTGYESGKWRTAEVAKYFHQDQFVLNGGALLTHEVYDYDEASRRFRTGVLFDIEATPARYSYQQVDLYPGSQIKRSFVAVEDPAEADYRTESVLDEFDRVSQTYDAIGTTLGLSVKTTFTYDAINGYLQEEKRSTFDETDSLWSDIVYRFERDELGRVTRRSNEGYVTQSNTLDEVTSYNGMGGVYEFYNEYDGEKGTVTRTSYNFAGLRTRQLSGVLDGPNALYTTNDTYYDLRGRATNEVQVAAGLADRATLHEYDGVGRRTRTILPAYSSTSELREITTEYTFDPFLNLPTITVTDPDGVSVATQQNFLGKPLTKDVIFDPAMPNPPTGAQLVEYSYAGGGGCGCSGGGLPVSVKTTDSSGWTTEVSRTYSPRGEVLEESIDLEGPGPGASSIGTQYSTQFEYDARSNIKTIEYPDEGMTPFVGGKLNYSYTDWAQVRSMELEFSETHKIGDYWYAGHQEIKRELFDVCTDALVVTATDDLDNFGRIVKRKWEAEPLYYFGRNTLPVAKIEDEVLTRDVDGRVLTRRVAPDTPATSAAPRPYVRTDYVGPGWVSAHYWYVQDLDEMEVLGTPDPTGPGYLTLEGHRELHYAYNAFGDVTSVTEKNFLLPGWLDYDDQMSPDYVETPLSVSWTNHRNDAGLLTSVDGLQPTRQRFGAWSRRASALVTSFIDDRIYDYDESGRLQSNEYTQNADTGCTDARTEEYPQGSNSYRNDYYDVTTTSSWTRQIEWDYEYDAWGRQTASIMSNPNPGGVSDNSYEDWNAAGPNNPCAPEEPEDYPFPNPFPLWGDLTTQKLYDGYGVTVRPSHLPRPC